MPGLMGGTTNKMTYKGKKKKFNSNIEPKIGGNQLRREYKKLKEEVELFRKQKGRDFQTMLTLSVHLYRLMPDHPVFNGELFNEEFLSVVKKQAEKKDKVIKKENNIEDAEIISNETKNA